MKSIRLRSHTSACCNLWLSIVVLLAVVTALAAQETTLQVDPSQATLKFSLGAALHAVHGSFQLKRGTLQFDAASGRISGEIVADAKSGESGNGTRDRKMHREILESERYPAITFRPDRVEAPVAPTGKSSVKVHGILNVHGTDHEITAPADVEMTADHWQVTAHLTIPYVKWGMKNPSTFFLRVSDSVEIDVVAGGSRQTSVAPGSAQ